MQSDIYFQCMFSVIDYLFADADMVIYPHKGLQYYTGRRPSVVYRDKGLTNVNVYSLEENPCPQFQNGLYCRFFRGQSRHIVIAP